MIPFKINKPYILNIDQLGIDQNKIEEYFNLYPDYFDKNLLDSIEDEIVKKQKFTKMLVLFLLRNKKLQNYSFSYCNNYCAFIYSKKPIGIDLEFLDKNKLQLVSEKMGIKQLNDYSIISLWTMCESLVKCRMISFIEALNIIKKTPSLYANPKIKDFNSNYCLTVCKSKIAGNISFNTKFMKF